MNAHFLPLFIAALVDTLSVQAQSPVGDQWPIAFVSEGYTVRVYAPHPISLDGDRFTARAAVALQRSMDKQPVFGAIWGDGLLAVDRNSRLGTLQRFEVNDVRFPDPIGQEADRIRSMLTREIPKHAEAISIDWLVAALESELHSGEAYVNDSPEIIYTERPSVLVFIDGEPEYLVLERRMDRLDDPVYVAPHTDIERVLNTPFLLLRYRRNAHYLYGSGRWFRASDIGGPYARVGDVPSSLRELAAEVDRSAPIATGSMEPEIVVRITPAELLDLNGPPSMAPIQSTGLLYATNTDKDLFLEIATQDYYLLASGRWYATRDPRIGGWRHVPGGLLPADLAMIPQGSIKDGVLAHVPGTDAAREAVRDSYIPQTASVVRKTATVDVAYVGDPVFERIDGTTVLLAVNANTTVLQIGDHYHACHNAVWYSSTSPFGPWTVSVEVPDAVSSIPPSSPAYHVRYVYIYDYTPDLVFVGYTPGYLGSYVQGGVVVLGTGYYYPRWPGFWYPRPFTWGFGSYYDPWVGWTFGYGWGWSWFYPDWVYWGWSFPARPWYAWGAYGWWGPWYHCPVWYDSPRPAYYGHRPSVNVPRVTAARTDLYSNMAREGILATAVQRSAKPQAPDGRQPVWPGTDRDHFPDREGAIYRRDRDRIERYDNGTWRRIPKEQPRTQPMAPRVDPRSILERRDRGDQRVRDLEHYRQRMPAPAPRTTPTPRTVPAPQRQASPTQAPQRKP